MTVLLLARTAVVTALTGAVLLSGLIVAGAASAAPDAVDRTVKASVSDNEHKVLNQPSLTVPHGRKLG